MQQINRTVNNAKDAQKRRRASAHPLVRFVLCFFGWVLTIIGAMLTVVSTICALAALFGGLELASFGQQLGFFVIYLVLAAVSFVAVRLGLRLKGDGARQKRPSGSHAAPHKATPQPTPEQQEITNCAEFSKNVPSMTALGTENKQTDRNQKAKALQRGEAIYLEKTPYTGLNNRPYAEEALPQRAKYILAEERFVSGHDDTAGFVELIDGDERVVRSWKFDYPMVKRFSQPDYYDDDCLVAYLRQTYDLPAVGYLEPEEKRPQKPRQGRPEGPVTVIRQLQFACDPEGAVYSFEKKVQKVETVQNALQKFVCVSEYHCVAGANGRPDAHLTECYYAIADSAEAEITAENWREKVHKTPEYCFDQFSNDVLY